MAQLETYKLKVRPVVDDKKVIEIMKKLYGFDVQSIEELNAYDDKNYRVTCYKEHSNNYVRDVAEHGYVLKVVNSLDTKDENFIRGQDEMMFYLNKHQVTCPVPVRNVHGCYYSIEKIHQDDENVHSIRLLTYVPGEILCNAKISPELLFNVGRFAAHLNETLRGFVYPPYHHRVHIWNLLTVSTLRDYLYVIKDDEDKMLILEIIINFEKCVFEKLNQLEAGMIHGDLNEQNIIVNSEHTDVAGIIDFGDSQHSYLIFELAIALCYMVIQSGDINMGKHVIAGYQSLKKLSDFEKSILKAIVCVRICQSIVIGSYAHSKEPQNNYVIVTLKSGWKVLRKLWFMIDDEVMKVWSLDK